MPLIMLKIKYQAQSFPTTYQIFPFIKLNK